MFKHLFLLIHFQPCAELDFTDNEEILVPDTLDSLKRQHMHDELYQPGIVSPITTNIAKNFHRMVWILLMMCFLSSSGLYDMLILLYTWKLYNN